MIKAILFNRDGLMIDSEMATFESFRYVLEKRGLNITKDFYCTLLGIPYVDNERIFFKKYGESFLFNKISQEVSVYRENQYEKNGFPAKKGLLPLLQYLKGNNYKTMVATSSHRQRANQEL